MNYKHVKLAWYGGEPLLEFDLIAEMTKKINKINQNYNVDCDIVMTTNGYLLNDNIVMSLEEIGFSYIQITLDGTKEVHDQRRVLLSGEGTYDHIINNIKLFRNSSVNVSVRVNIDKDNYKCYKTIEKIIKRLNMKNVKIYPALVEFSENQDTCRECKYMTAKEYGEFASDEAADYYINGDGGNINNININCAAEHMNSFVIDDYGDVYKCWNSIGYKKERIFSLTDKDVYNPIVMSRYLGRDPFSESECRECEYLPICGGGCAYDYILKGVHTCIPERFFYEKLIFKGGDDDESDKKSK